MRAFDAGVIEALESGAAVLVWFLELDFGEDGVYRFNTSNWDITFEGDVYYGAYGLGSISPIKDQPGQVGGLQIDLNGGPADRISLALDDADIVQGAPVTLRAGIFSPSTYALLDAPIEWQGYLDTMAIADDGNNASIRCTAENRAVDLIRGVPLTYSDADQQYLHPGDRSFEYVVSQIDQDVVWPSKAWFYK